MRLLEPSEIELVGRVEMVSETPKFDTIARRIFGLIENSLHHIVDDDTGWRGLYLDPQDGRIWERDYPDSDLAGGGAPRLREIQLDVAASRYHLDQQMLSELAP